MTAKNPPLERIVVKKILETLRKRGGFWIKLHGSIFMISGLPDIIGCENGRFYAFEVKREAGIPAKPIQEFYMKKIRAAGGTAELVYSVDQTLSYLL